MEQAVNITKTLIHNIVTIPHMTVCSNLKQNAVQQFLLEANNTHGKREDRSLKLGKDSHNESYDL